MPNESDSNSRPLHSSSQSGEGIRWSTWPCLECSQGGTEIGRLIRRIEASKSIQGTVDSITKLEIECLQQWVESCTHRSPTSLNLPELSSGSEHVVYIDSTHAKVMRLTLPEIYGDFYYLDDRGVMNQERCTPLDYLARLHLWKKLFGSAPRALGITERGQIVSEHAFIKGSQPQQEQVDDFLEKAGFSPIKKQCWFWERAIAGTDLLYRLGDARSDNFIIDPSGNIVPIDIRLWIYKING